MDLMEQREAALKRQAPTEETHNDGEASNAKRLRSFLDEPPNYFSEELDSEHFEDAVGRRFFL